MDVATPTSRNFTEAPMAVGEFAEGDSSIFWDLADSKIMAGLNPYSIFKKFRSALEHKGYHGPVSIRAYVDENTLSQEFVNDCEVAGIQIIHVPQRDYLARVYTILHDMSFWAMKRRSFDRDTRRAIVKPSTLVMILSETAQKDPFFARGCKRVFRIMEYNVFSSPYESFVKLSGSSQAAEPIIPPPNNTVFIIAGTSGAGKDAVIKRLREVREDRLHFLVTVTSCENTTGENYAIVSECEFRRMMAVDEILQYNERKGISKAELRESLAKEGRDIVLSVDHIEEARHLQAVLGCNAVFIFLVVESDISVPASSSEKLASLAGEEAWYLHFDHFVFNAKGSSLDDSVESLESIIDSDKFKFRPTSVSVTCV